MVNKKRNLEIGKISNFQGKSGKIFKFLFVLVLLYFLVVVFDIPVPFRYSFFGDNTMGVVYKTDKLTGKTVVISPFGEKEIKKPKPPTPTPVPISFPIEDIELREVKSRWTKSKIYISDDDNNYLFQLYGVVKNNNQILSIKEFTIKVEFYNQKNGEVVDTKYLRAEIKVPPQTTVSFTTEGASLSPILKNTFWYTYTISDATAF